MRIIRKSKDKVFVLIAIMLLLSASIIYAQNKDNQSIEISFLYSKVSGFSSNQYAIWVENENGDYIKTIYVTKFTATKGWKTRPEAIPVWVKKSNISKIGKKQVDLISGATPKTGEQKYYWDFTDNNGKAVTDGKYTIVFEATFDGNSKDPSEVQYKAIIDKGKTIEILKNGAEYKGNSQRGKTMIDNVKYEVVKK